MKRSLRLLKRPSTAKWTFIDDCRETDATVVVQRITNLHECNDGLFEVIMTNEQRDWETGCVEDWDYELRRITDDERKALKLWL
jgi:phage FluMu gp28-like protein